MATTWMRSCDFSSAANGGGGVDVTAACLFLSLTLGTASAEEVRIGETVCRLAVDATTIPLSGELNVTLSVEGKAPVDVELPRALTASPDWRVRAAAPKMSPLSGGRERWEQAFRLEPFQTGAAVLLPVQPLNYRTGNEVTDRVLTWKPLAIRVTTEVTGTDLTQARPPTGIEELPSIAQTPFPWLAVVAGLLVAALVAMSVRIGLRKGRSSGPMLSARERALEELRQIRADDLSPAEVERLADIVRRFFEHHLSLAATKQTTSEFLASVRKAGTLPDEPTERLLDLLRRCDLVKFAGMQMSALEGRALLDDSHQLIIS
jgi:hypothetical protein